MIRMEDLGMSKKIPRMSDLASEKGTTKTKDWSELSLAVLTEIGRRIVEYKEFIWFGSVCRFWKLASSMEDFRSKSTAAFLLIRCRHDNAGGSRIIYNPASRQPCRNLNEILDDKPPFRQSGEISSKGWVLEVRETDLQPLLWNHSTTIELPDFRCVRCYGDILSFHLREFDISSDPSSTSSYTIIITAEVLFSRSGGHHRYHGGSGGHVSMTFLWHKHEEGDGNNNNNLPAGRRCRHPVWLVFPSTSRKIVCFKGVLATFQMDGSYDVRGPNYTSPILPVPRFPDYNLHEGVQQQQQQQHGPFFPRCCERKYMLESQKGLMVIVQLLDNSSLETKELHVFELDWASKEWKQVEDLGCRALFLKPYQTPILLDCNRFLANKIYSVSTSYDADIKLEIYNFSTKSFESPLQFPPCHIEPCLQTQWIFHTKKINPDS